VQIAESRMPPRAQKTSLGRTSKSAEPQQRNHEGESRPYLVALAAKAGTSIPAVMLPWVLIPAQVPTRISQTVLVPTLMLARMPPAVVLSFSRRQSPRKGDEPNDHQ
jgi:hypothetical protein